MECIDLTLQKQATSLCSLLLPAPSPPSTVAVEIGPFAEKGVRPGPRCTEFRKMTVKETH